VITGARAASGRDRCFNLVQGGSCGAEQRTGSSATAASATPTDMAGTTVVPPSSAGWQTAAIIAGQPRHVHPTPYLAAVWPGEMDLLRSRRPADLVVRRSGEAGKLRGLAPGQLTSCPAE
jgi:hypothetical protein